jgi:hypothetical protein
MGRAFRSDAANGVLAPAIAELTQHRRDLVEPEYVTCPVEGCDVRYVVYNYVFSDRRSNLEALQYGLRIHHPEHPAAFRLNEPVAEGA